MQLSNHKEQCTGKRGKQNTIATMRPLLLENYLHPLQHIYHKNSYYVVSNIDEWESTVVI